MTMPKPTDETLERFRALVPDGAGVEVKPMFGQLGAFVNGNMFMGLFGSDVGVKLAETERAELLAKPGAGPFGPPGRPMGGWVTVPADWTPDDVQPWAESALAHIGALPPKKAKGAPKKA